MCISAILYLVSTDTATTLSLSLNSSTHFSLLSMQPLSFDLATESHWKDKAWSESVFTTRGHSSSHPISSSTHATSCASLAPSDSAYISASAGHRATANFCLLPLTSDFAFDDFRVSELPQFDAATQAITSPNSTRRVTT